MHIRIDVGLLTLAGAVTFVIGKLNTVPRQAHWMRRFCKRACVTPTTLTSMTVSVTT